MNYSKIKKITKSIGIRKAVFDCDTSSLCSIRSGGKVAALVSVDNSQDMAYLMTALEKEKIKYVILGGGTNTIFTRDLLDLVVIKPGRGLEKVNIDSEGRIEAGASAVTPVLVKKAAAEGLDLSFLAGIPGTVGGAVFGNSGSAGEWISGIIVGLKYIRWQKDRFMLAECGRDAINEGYRTIDVPRLAAVISVVLKPKKIGRDEVALKIRQNLTRRKKTQPLGARTSGCFFKNPEGGEGSAGALIEGCGLKSFLYGGARVSPIHANFIENFNNASPEDIVVLSRIIIEKVREKYGVSLEYEVKLIGWADEGQDG